MGDLSKDFSRHEFACHDGCGFDAIKPELIRRLQLARDHFNAKIYISSACRCPKWNKHEGGEPNSQHLLGTAADIKVEGVAPGVVADWFESQWPESGVGRYKTFTHVDVRPYKARWKR